MPHRPHLTALPPPADVPGGSRRHRAGPGLPAECFGEGAVRTVRASATAMGPGAAHRGFSGGGRPHREGHRRRRGARKGGGDILGGDINWKQEKEAEKTKPQHTKQSPCILNKAPTDYAKPRQTIQSPDRLYKAPMFFYKGPGRRYH